MDRARENRRTWDASNPAAEPDRFRQPAKRSPALDPLTDEQRDLAGRYWPLARSLARAASAEMPGARDELESAAYLGLVRAARAFDPSLGFAFATLARSTIAFAIAAARREAGRRGRIRTERLTEALAGDDEPAGAELERADQVEACLKLLPDREADACRQRYLHGRGQAEAAAELGVSRATLARLQRSALDRLAGAVA